MKTLLKTFNKGLSKSGLFEICFLVIISVFLIITVFPSVTRAVSLPAFPGAEGFGADNITGGRGGEIRIVSNLNDSGPGSFREAVDGDDKKIVVFAVSGVIRLKSGMYIGSNTTIAGQTSPGGVTIYLWEHGGIPGNDAVDGKVENGLIILKSNIIVRHMRFRGSRYGQDALTGYSNNVILDHCSFSWSGDELVNFWTGSENIIIQWCTMEESVGWWHGEGKHNFGPLIGSQPGNTPSGNVSIHHNLMAHHMKRNPELQIGLDLASDVRNNLIYDPGHGVNIVVMEKGPWAGKHSVVNNYIKKGPSTDLQGKPLKPLAVYFPKTWETKMAGMGKSLEVYYSGNVIEDTSGHAAVDNSVDYWIDPALGEAGSPVFLGLDPHNAVTTNTANESYELVIEKAGAWPRDDTTLRTIDEVKNGTGGWVMMDQSAMYPDMWVGWGEKYYPSPYTRFYRDDANNMLNISTLKDSDSDGMSDKWETSKGLNPNDHLDAVSLVPKGGSSNDKHMDYTYIEYYINELADDNVSPDSPLNLRVM